MCNTTGYCWFGAEGHEQRRKRRRNLDIAPESEEHKIIQLVFRTHTVKLIEVARTMSICAWRPDDELADKALHMLYVHALTRKRRVIAGAVNPLAILIRSLSQEISRLRTSPRARLEGNVASLDYDFGTDCDQDPWANNLPDYRESSVEEQVEAKLVVDHIRTRLSPEKFQILKLAAEHGVGDRQPVQRFLHHKYCRSAGGSAYQAIGAILGKREGTAKQAIYAASRAAASAIRGGGSYECAT